MAKNSRREGRVVIFRDKVDGSRYQGVVTPVGAVAFEAARERLARLAKLKPTAVSDGDCIEFLARGEVETINYLERQ